MQCRLQVQWCHRWLQFFNSSTVTKILQALSIVKDISYAESA